MRGGRRPRDAGSFATGSHRRESRCSERNQGWSPTCEKLTPKGVHDMEHTEFLSQQRIKLQDIFVFPRSRYPPQTEIACSKIPEPDDLLKYPYSPAAKRPVRNHSSVSPPRRELTPRSGAAFEETGATRMPLSPELVGAAITDHPDHVPKLVTAQPKKAFETRGRTDGPSSTVSKTVAWESATCTAQPVHDPGQVGRGYL